MWNYEMYCQGEVLATGCVLPNCKSYPFASTSGVLCDDNPPSISVELITHSHHHSLTNEVNVQFTRGEKDRFLLIFQSDNFKLTKFHVFNPIQNPSRNSPNKSSHTIPSFCFTFYIFISLNGPVFFSHSN